MSYMKYEISDEYEDATIKSKIPSIRSEVIGYVMIQLGNETRTLQDALNMYRCEDVARHSRSIITLFEGLTQQESSFLNWISSDARCNKEAISDNESVRNYWDASYRYAGAGHIMNVLNTGNKGLIDSAVDRWKKVFDLAIPAYLKDSNAYYDSTNISTIDIEEDILYIQYVEYLISEYIEMANIEIRRHNRQCKEARKCEKCGTEFQLAKSRNMHHSKCNGVNRGYLPFVSKGSKADRTSEW